MTAKIKLNAASGGGSVSLKAPSTTTSNAAVELQLPVADGSANQFMKTDGSGNLAFAAAGGGKILQVVNQTATTAKTTSGATKLEIINVTITPAATSSKIFVIADATIYIQASSNAIGYTFLYRGDSSGTQLNQNNHGSDAGSGIYTSSNINFLDSPNTTSATVYTLVMQRGSGNTTHLETSGNRYSLTAFEVGA